MRNSASSASLDRRAAAPATFVATLMPVRSLNTEAYQRSAGTRPNSSSAAGRRSVITPRMASMVVSTSPAIASRRGPAISSPPRLQLLLERLQVDAERGQVLADQVVQLVGDAAPLGFLRLHQPVEQAAHVLGVAPRLLLGLHARA